MSRSIGDIPVDLMSGLPQKIRTRTDVWEVPGIDGYGSQTLGQGEAAFDLVTVAYVGGDGTDPNSPANAYITQYLALQSTLVTIVDPWGDTYSKILVQHVDVSGPNAKRAVLIAGNKAIRLEAHWKLFGTV